LKCVMQFIRGARLQAITKSEDYHKQEKMTYSQ
jgi:hypothetical protein